MFENDLLLYTLIMISAFCKSVEDTIFFHFYDSIFNCMRLKCECDYWVPYKRYLQKINNEKDSSLCYDFNTTLNCKQKLFYWLESSWDYQRENRKKYPVLSRIFWFLFDGWHFFDTMKIVSIFVSVLFVSRETMYSDMIYCFIIYIVVFNVFFHCVLLSKTYK